MESQTPEREISFVLQLPQSSNDEMIIDENSTIAPVIIEELEESQVTMMDVNINEFIEAQALEVCQVHNEDSAMDTSEVIVTHCDIDISDGDCDGEDDILTQEEENRLTKQFLNGDLTFSEYSSRMDRNMDNEAYEDDISRTDAAQSKEVISRAKSEEKRDKKPRKKRKRNLPVPLQGLMGEANLRLARGEIDIATQMCMEIIRQVPCAPEPFQTLATIYETEDPEKALQFSLIAAHLNPKDSEQWTRLANLSLDTGNIKQAITCLSKAIQADSTNVELYEARAKLQQQNGDTRAYLKGYVRLINQLGPENGQEIVKYAKLLTQKFIQESNYDEALKAMEQIFNKCQNLISLEEINIMTELLISMKKFRYCLDILTKYTKIAIKYGCTLLENDQNKEKMQTVESVEIPVDIVVDLKAKCIVALIELNYIQIADGLSHQLLIDENPDVSGDLFLDIAEALMSRKEYLRALKYLEPLINSQNYSLAAVWLRYAECWVGCKNLKKAILSYEIVAKLSPLHLEARLQLSTLYKCFGQYQRAIGIISQDPDVDIIDSEALYRKTLLLYKIENYEEFLNAGFLLLARHCENIRTKSELTTLMRPSVRQRLEALQLHRLSRAEPLDDENAPTFSNNPLPTVKNEFKLFLLMCHVTCKLKKYNKLQRLCFTTLTSKRFEFKTRHIIFLCLVSCIYNNDSYFGYNLVRDMVRDTRQSNLWNLLNIVIQRADDSRHNRFIMRLLGREDAFSYLHILHANNCLVSGTYKYALNDYVSLFKVGPSSLLALLIAITFLQMACQKFTANKHRLVTQAYAFFKKYAEIRGDDMTQESNYNMARAFHQLGLLSGAVQFYKLVLESPSSKLIADNSQRLDLKREAAFNIHLIYMQSGNPDLARIYLEHYITRMAALAGKIEFQKLCRVFEDTMKARGNVKIQILQRFIFQCREMGKKLKEENLNADISMFPIMRLLMVKNDRERGAHGLKEKTLGDLYIRIFCLGKNSPEAEKIKHYREPSAGQKNMNDFAERLYWVLKPRLKSSSSITVEQVNHILDKIAGKYTINESKDLEFINLMQLCSGFELKWITRLILKDMKLGLGEKSIFDVYHPHAARLYGEISNLRNVCDMVFNINYKLQQTKSNITVLMPFKPMLLERMSISDIEKLFMNKCEKYIVQTKFDGERSQLHMKNGKFKYYTRHGFDITENKGYGASRQLTCDCLTNKISSLLNPDCKSIILDGELMGWHKEKRMFGSKGMAFDVKKLTRKSNYQPCFVAFDIISYNEQLLLNVPLEKRLNILEGAFQECEGTLVRSKNINITSSNELVKLFNESLDNNDEGIVVKKSDAIYSPNKREHTGCYKIKAEYSDGLIQDIDMVIIGGYYGEGKHSGVFNSFLMGVAIRKGVDDADEKLEFYSTVSVSTGLSMSEIKNLNARLEQHWTKECPDMITGPRKNLPNYWIHPKNSVVLQLRATEMIRCSNQPTRYTLRFPRVIKIREDKPWYNTCTIDEFNSLVRSPGVVQKLTKRHATIDDINRDMKPKKLRTCRVGAMNVTNIHEKYFGIKSSGIAFYSRLFEGKDFCVLNGEEKWISKPERLTKIDIEKILLTHSAKIVQNPSKTTFCIIVGNSATAKIQNLIYCRKYDIASVDWLRRATEEKNWAAIIDWHPWEMLAFRPTTIEKLYQDYDEYYDSFIDDSDDTSLKRSLNRVGTLNDEYNFSTDDFIQLEKNLFTGKLSSGGLSIFRNIVGYFIDSADDYKFAFKFMRGKINVEIDTSVTHIFIAENFAVNYTDLYTKVNEFGGTLVKIVKSEWINKCFVNNKLLSTTEFTIK